MAAGIGANIVHAANAIDVAEDQVPTQATVHPHGTFEVHALAARQPAKRRDARRFGTDIGVQLIIDRRGNRRRRNSRAR